MDLGTPENNSSYFKKLLPKKTNQKCFDCDAANPRWVSVNNAVFFCRACALGHKQDQNENTRVKDIDRE